MGEEWNNLWDIDFVSFKEPACAEKVMELSTRISEIYRDRLKVGTPTETLLTKILLGTLCCVPAYDTYFKKALKLTGVATQAFSKKSLIKLGEFYSDHVTEFQELQAHCSGRVPYPSAKIVDMSFFEYGYRN